MKKTYFIILTTILTSFFLESCSKFCLFPEKETPYHHSILREISDTITNHPKEALSLLKNIDIQIIENDFSKQEYHEYQILLAEALYKNHYPQENYNEVIAAEHYFDSLSMLYPTNTDILFQCARASYYKAVKYEEKENIKEAFISYLKSLEIIEDINTENTSQKLKQEILHFNALTYIRLSDILYLHNIYDAAIDCIKKANELFKSENNIVAISRNHTIMAVIEGTNNNHDEALLHLYTADSLLKKASHNTLLEHDIERIKASVMYNAGYKEEAFNSVLKQYKTLDDEKQLMETAGVLGDMYYDKKIYDSAIYYYERYYPYNKYSKINIVKNIFDICLITGDNQLISKYANSIAEETNKEIMLQSLKTELISLYIQHEANIKESNLYSKIILYLVIILIITAALFILGLNLIKLKKGKYNRIITENKNYINSLQRKINATTHENKNIKTKIKILENEILDYKNNINKISFEQRLESIKGNSIYKRIYETSIDSSIKANVPYPDLQLDESETKEIIDLFNNAFDNVLTQIISEHKGLKYHDMLYFCLYIIGSNEKHISAITGKTYNAVWSRTKKIQEILGNKKIKDIIKERLKIS